MPAQHPNQYDFDKVFRFVNLLNTGQVPASNSGCYVTGGIVSNANAAIRYVKLYDKLTAATSSDTPVMTIMVPASSTVVLPASLVAFVNGLSARACTGQADNDNTAPTANDIVIDIFYRG